MQEFIF